MHQPQKVNDNKGLAVHFTHESWNMVLNIMMGIRYAIGRVMMEPDRPLCSNDYTMKEKMTIVPHKLSSVTSGGSVGFSFRLYRSPADSSTRLPWCSESSVRYGEFPRKSTCRRLVHSRFCVRL